MSSKTTIFLTEDNEHCYLDGSQPDRPLVLEMSDENIVILVNDNDGVVIQIRPNCQLYEIIKKLKI
jgi:hypothetical protein